METRNLPDISTDVMRGVVNARAWENRCATRTTTVCAQAGCSPGSEHHHALRFKLCARVLFVSNPIPLSLLKRVGPLALEAGALQEPNRACASQHLCLFMARSPGHYPRIAPCRRSYRLQPCQAPSELSAIALFWRTPSLFFGTHLLWRQAV